MTQKTKSKILDKIEKENISPIPKSHFDWKNRLIWMWVWMLIFFWIMFTSFIIDDMIEYLSFWPWFLNGPSLLFFLPHLFWLILISVIIFFAYKEFRDTKKGHRYNIFMILWIFSLILIIWSFTFFKIWFGPSMHGFVKGSPFIPNFLYDEKTWNNQEWWRIAGEITKISWLKIAWNKNSWVLELKTFDSKTFNINIVDKTFVSPKTKFVVWEKIRVFWDTDKINSSSWILNFNAKWIMPWSSPGFWPHMRWWKKWFKTWDWWNKVEWRWGMMKNID